MYLPTNKSHRLLKAIVASAAAAAIFASAAQAHFQPGSSSTPSSNIDGWAYKYFQPASPSAPSSNIDGWAYKYFQPATSSTLSDSIDGWAYKYFQPATSSTPSDNIDGWAAKYFQPVSQATPSNSIDGSVRTYLLTQRASSPVPLVTDHGTGRGRSLERGASAQVATSNGFDWADAGIGAAGALGAFLLAGGAALSARKRRPLAQAHR